MLAALHRDPGIVALERSRLLTAWGAGALALVVAVSLCGQTAILAGSTGLSILDALGAESAMADIVQFVGAIGILAFCLVRTPAPNWPLLLLLAGMVLLGSAVTRLVSAAAALLLTHSHTLGNVKERLLGELTHAPLALFGVAAGWALGRAADRSTRKPCRRLDLADLFYHCRADPRAVPRGLSPVHP